MQIGLVEAILDQVGNPSPGAQINYSMIVLNPSNQPVPIPGSVTPPDPANNIPGSPGQFGETNQIVVFGYGNGDSLNALQTAIINQVFALWQDNTISVVFL